MRKLITAFYLFVVAAGSLAGAVPARAQTDPLPSWNDGAPKKAILDFVARVTKEGRLALPRRARVWRALC